jgi:hypothetical protein
MTNGVSIFPSGQFFASSTYRIQEFLFVLLNLHRREQCILPQMIDEWRRLSQMALARQSYLLPVQA